MCKHQFQSDFSILYNGAVDAANGDFSFAESPYSLSWVYQLGFTMYQAYIIFLFGESSFILKLFNVVYSVGITVLIYKITTQLFHEERISDTDILSLFVKKFYFMWGSDDDSIMWSTAHFTTLEYSSTLQFLERVIYILMMFFGALSGGKLIRDHKNKRMNPAVLLFVLLILGYVAIHLLIEIQTRYRYFIMPSFIILQSYGIYFILYFLFRQKIINRLLFKY